MVSMGVQVPSKVLFVLWWMSNPDTCIEMNYEEMLHFHDAVDMAIESGYLDSGAHLTEKGAYAVAGYWPDRFAESDPYK